ncbi:MAG: hypothetical protein A4E26_00877 [Methanobacterium sp. PtaU1.Bin097]|nr:MAG: hypothetical protein A4E26_00877 [Methanobacterium sp. PtaU1.Bin097]
MLFTVTSEILLQSPIALLKTIVPLMVLLGLEVSQLSSSRIDIDQTAVLLYMKFLKFSWKMLLFVEAPVIVIHMVSLLTVVILPY